MAARQKKKVWWSGINKFRSRYGSDYSDKYTTLKSVEFYFLKQNYSESTQLVLFKPFLKDLSYNFSVKTKEIGANLTTANPEQIITGQDAKIKVGLELPAVSINEAKINAKKVDFFLRMLSAEDANSDKQISIIDRQAKADAAQYEEAKEESLSEDEILKALEAQKQQSEDPSEAAQANNVDLGADPEGAQLVADSGAEATNETTQAMNENMSILENLRQRRASEESAPKEEDENVMMDTPYNENDTGITATEALTGKLGSFNGNTLDFYASFSNLVQSGKYRKELKLFDSKDETNTYKNIEIYGFACNITNIDIDVNTDMGFFEDKVAGYLWPKSYSIGCTLEMINRSGAPGSRTKNIYGFGEHEDDPEMYSAHTGSSANYHLNDVRSWPFGIDDKLLKKAKKSIGSDYSSKYTRNQRAKIEISKYSQKVDFKPFLKSFKVKRKIDNKNMLKTESLHSQTVTVFDTKQPGFDISFSVVASSVGEAVVNMEKVQRLLRMMWASGVDGLTQRAQLLFKFANLINSNTLFGVGSKTLGDGLRVVCKKIDIKPELEMGFFEYGGMLYIKSFDLTFSLETVDSSLSMRI